MQPFPPDEPDQPPDADLPAREGTPVVLVATAEVVPLSVAEIEDERTPDGMACMGTFIDERLIARSAVPPEALEELHARDVLDAPVRLALAAVERAPGLQCRLFALVPASQFEEEEPEEPWAASVPRFEDLEEGGEDEEEAEDAFVPLLLGHIVRFDRDRKYPDDLPREAADVLRAVLADDHPLVNVIDKALEDLLGP